MVEHRLPMIDVVDAHDRVIGVVTRAELRRRRLRHRAVYLLVVSSGGGLLVHRRSEQKDLWPGRWDLAAGGVVESGESYDSAAVRELAEELGVVAAPEPLGAGAYEDGACAVLGRVYLVRHDGPFTFTDGEITEAEWVRLADLPALLRTRPWCPDSIALALPLLPTAE